MRRPIIQALLLAAVGAGCSTAPTGETGTVAPGVQPGATGAAGAGAAAPAATPGTNTGTTTTTNTATGAATPAGMMPVGAATPGAPGTAVPGTGAANTPAAGGAPTTAGMATNTTGAAPATDLPMATGGPISEACRGFDFTNLVYSPGGDVLPNKCEAFHGTLNNPHAVRCVDAWPWYKTKYPGDNYCILPPSPEKGVQLGLHPQGEGNAWHDAVSKGDMSGYENLPGAGWTLDPGGEEERNIVVKHTNAAGKYYRLYNRMRGGSHHMIVSAIDNPSGTYVWGPGGADGLFNGAGIPGAQRPDENTPQAQLIPDEDMGLYRSINANIGVQYNMHHFNSTDKQILKEAWQNVWWTDNAKTAVNGINGLPLVQAIGMFANPGEIVDMHYASTIPAPMRVLGLFGHRHAWTTNFTAWVEKGGKEEIIYQSFDWFDEPTFQYNSQVKNPVPNPMARTDGAFTGILNLAAGDKLHFNCHIEYTDERAKEENSPVTPQQNGPLRFANQAFQAEMCILFGASVGDTGAMEQLGPPPAFAKMR